MMLIPENTTICVPTSGLGFIAVCPSFEEGEDPTVNLVQTKQLEAMDCQLSPENALRLGRALVAAGELLTRPEDRITMAGEP
jgi:hypothetical protein